MRRVQGVKLAKSFVPALKKAGNTFAIAHVKRASRRSNGPIAAATW
jgi:hypothetical protein